ncbi:uncharacterized protein EI90DRAFT_3067310 [Cantharellus anzutake]|uniref:uncharacterized protein n=1 Tax=Cantharellus anzutake TaxID=1750568 RepID=UPI0019067AA3|nr:uncharacterized protein EI90DRAFT_3067310 [Cantharellus anzutake]KAF8327584.1 hypothetical protein EI90DRAFT_3067310 [Cantharellus anzutake]
MNNLLSIRCMTFQFAADSSLHTSLTFSCLKNLELFLSPETFPSLTHLTLRTPTGRTSVSAEGIRALISFLEKFGAQLKVLTLRICPGDDMSWDDFAENAQLDDLEEPTSDRISIPRILALCPNVDDIIFSSRWLGVHRDGRFSPSSYSHQPTGRRYSGWRHPNVKRIGHYYPWESPHSRGRALRDGIDESMPMLPNMTRRQCIIDHELSILIGSIPPVRDAYPSKEPRRSFPGLQSIHLLDADPTEMFDSDAPFDDLPFSRGSSPPTRSRSPGPLSLYSRVRDVPVTLDERTFWRAWSARCSNKNVKLVDGDGKIVSRYKANGDVMGGGGGGHYYNGNYPAGGGEADDDFSVSGRVGRALMRTLSGGRDSDDGRRVDGILDWIRNFS